MKFADGFNEAFIGYAERGATRIALYDTRKCVAILCERDGMSPDDALDFFYYNVVPAWVGDETPGYVTFVDKIEDVFDEET